MSTKTFQSFTHFNYRLWFLGNIFASTGIWMQRVAQDWLVLTVLTDNSGFQVGVVTALQFLPILLFSPLAGVAADRFNRRRLLQLAQIAAGVLGVTLGILILTGVIQLWMVYVLAFLGGIVSAFDHPTRNAFVSDLVPTNMLPNAIALNATAFNSARLIGPAVSGLAIDMVGIGWVFLVNAGFFMLPAITLALMRKNDLNNPEVVPREKGQVREGLRYVRDRKDIFLIMILVGIVSMFGLNFQLTSAMMATEVFGLPAGGYGLMSTALAVGAVVGSLLAARRNNPRLRVIVGAAVLFGVMLGVIALVPTYYWFLIVAVPLGVLSMTLVASANAAVQISTEPWFLGRVMALYSMVFLGSTPIGAPIVGWVGEHFGARWSMGVPAIICVLAAVAVALWGVYKWHVRLRVSWMSLSLDVPPLAWKRSDVSDAQSNDVGRGESGSGSAMLEAEQDIQES